MTELRALLDELTAVARAVGDPSADLAVAGEGNVSGRSAAGRLLVSKSGGRLGEADDASWVEVATAPLLAALDSPPMHDEAWLDVLQASRVRAEDPRPTTEVALHAVLGELTGASHIIHVHPTALLAFLCSGRTEWFSTMRIFPDQVVMVGRADAVIPYVDPGQGLARAARAAVAGHQDAYGEAPRVILLENHGVFALGGSAREALDRIRMTAKVARVLGAMPVGVEPARMSPAHIDRIAGREDEAYRRRLLASDRA